MCKSIFFIALLIFVEIILIQCQFGNPFFGNQPQQQQQQQNQGNFPFPFQQTGFPQLNQNFGFFQPQNFDFPINQNSFNLQNQQNVNQQNQPNHQNNFAQTTRQPVNPPTVQPSHVASTTARSTQRATSTTTTSKTTAFSSLEDERISQKKCNEYSKLVTKTVQFTSLSLDSVTQDLSFKTCDALAGLVVGGKDAGINEFPHQAAIGYPNLNGVIEFKCGGSLISEFFILTAAHCRKSDRTFPTTIRLGDLNLKEKEFGLPEVDIPIEQFISHEAYNTETKQNDIAVIKMRQAATFSKSIRPACLQQTENIGKTKAIATGWGYTEVGGSRSDILQKVQLDIISNKKCDTLFNDQENYKIFASQICAGVLSGGKDTCGGDSGGPLQTTIGNQCLFNIIGVTSYGSTFCGVKNSPGIYTRVSSYIDWIESKVWK